MQCIQRADMRLIDSVIPLRSARAFTGQNASDAWDYFHINSVDKDDEGNYLVSGRHMSTLYKVNGKTGELIWQLGGKKSTFSLVDSWSFGYQHDARFVSRSADGKIETISFFDNSARSDRQRTGGVDRLHPHSRGRIVRLNHTDNTATEVQTFIPPDLLSVPSQGNTQVLENGNVFVNWGQEGAVTEFKADGTPIFHAYLDSGALAPGVQSYRGFRYEWTGYSSEVPAIAALRSEHETTVYVSWNGDTRVKTWRFYSQCGRRNVRPGQSSNKLHSLGDAKRVSFETSLTIPTSVIQCSGQEALIFAEGIDAAGAVLTTTDSAVVQQDVKPTTAGYDNVGQQQHPIQSQYAEVEL